MEIKQISRFFIITAILAASAFLVYALAVDTGVSNAALTSPIVNQNISGSFLLNVTAAHITGGDGNLTNVTVFFWNASDDSLVYNTTLTDDDQNVNLTFNATISSSGLLGDGLYNVSINSTNASDGSILVNDTVLAASELLNVDNTVPDVQAFNAPTAEQNFTTGGTVVLNTTISNTTGTAIETVIFQVTNGSDPAFNVTTSSTNATLFNASVLVSALGDGSHTVTAYANDTAGNMNDSETTTFNVDTVAPNVQAFNAPTAEQNYSSGNVLINVSVNDASTAVETVIFQVTNGSDPAFNVTASNTNTTLFNASVAVSALGDGSHTITVYANDTVGIMNDSETTTFNTGTVNPSVEGINTPVAEQNFTTGGTVVLNATVSNSTILAVETVIFQVTNGSDPAFNVTASSTNATLFNASVLVSALGDGSHTVTVYANDTGGNLNDSETTTFNVDTVAPSVTAFNTPDAASYHNDSFVLNVSVSGTPTLVQYRVENGTNSSHVPVSYTNLSSTNSSLWNVSVTVNTSIFSEGNFTLRINATDVSDNSNTTETLIFGVDYTNPVNVSVSCDDVTVGGSQSCTCSANDNSETYGGSVSTSISSASTSTTGTKTVTCTATDLVGHTNTSTATYSVNAAASSSSGGGSGATGASGGTSLGVQGQFEKRIWTSINAGETAVVDVDNGVIGVTEISFSVDSTVWGAWVQVEKKDTLPSSVSELAKKAYRYVEITKGPALTDDGVGSPVIKFKVEKSWLSENGLGSSGVALYRYVDGEWVELATTVGNDDGTYVHYSAETPGFSYFAIGEGTASTAAAPSSESDLAAGEPAAEPTTEPAPVDSGAETTPSETPEVKEGSSVWAWVITLLVLAALGFGAWYWLTMKKSAKK